MFCGFTIYERFKQGEDFFHLCYQADEIEAFGQKLQDDGIILYKGPAFLGNVAEKPFVAELARCNSKTFLLLIRTETILK